MHSHGDMKKADEQSSRRGRNITIMPKVVVTCIIAILVQQHSLGRHIRCCNNVWRHAFEHWNEPLKFTVQIPTFRAALLQMSNIVPGGASHYTEITHYNNLRTSEFTHMIYAYYTIIISVKLKMRYFRIYISWYK